MPLFLTLSSFSPFSFAFTAAPDFVRGLSDEEYVYFFFREQAVEYINCGKVSMLVGYGGVGVRRRRRGPH